ncbi:6-pyruvoyl-tetrahydropterin synthase-related protein [Levilactobacillus zymae]|uniref:6-pyruvoyl-tetrahydropterin synthase-related protein n=1 Tax=Levilactobacillus zymae TaxID=267363 RepID=UPI0028BC3983|nr:6-pyruvoyl-tetrahydropterin synthase-related protein [Levilactobacillus zymae]MDT6981357.1 6-pyruvoyl-tetrahydropterin synthase-related protein [Levilactobacillus zymae]
MSRWGARHWRLLESLAFLGLSLIWLLPWAFSGRLYLGDDLQFHLNRLQGLTHYIATTGRWWAVPPVTTGAFSEWGYPINLFYPAVTLLPAAWLHLVVNGVTAYYLFLGLVTDLTLELTAWVGRRLLDSRLAGAVLAVIYGFAQYRLLDFFVRGALAEGLVLAVLPLVIYGAYCLIAGDDRQWFWLAIGMALVALTHVLSVVLCSLAILGMLGLWGLRRDRLKARLGHLVLAGGATVLLAATFLVPLAEQLYRSPSLGVMRYQLAQSALQPGQFLRDTLQNRVTSDHVGLGLSLLLASLVAVLAWRRLRSIDRYFLILGWVNVWLATRWFPWRLLQGPLGMLQFPWRCLTLATFFIALAGAQGMVQLGRPSRLREQLGLLVGVTVIVVSLSLTANQRLYRQVATGPKIVTATTYHAATQQAVDQDADYLPAAATPTMAAIRTKSVAVMNTQPNGQRPSGLHVVSRRVQPLGVSYRIRSRTARIVRLPVIYFYDDRVWVNGRPQDFWLDATRVIAVQLRRGINRVTYRYHPTVSQRVSGWVSLVVWLGGLGLVIRWRRRPER